MILIVTLNPLLEYRFYTNIIIQGTAYRNVPCKLQAGGKGINVSRQLAQLGIHSYNVMFLGSTEGKKIREALTTEHLEFTAVKTKDDSRIAHVLIEEESKKVTTLFCVNSRITDAEANEMKARLDKMIQNCEIVVFSGSSPDAIADDIFTFGIEAAHRYDKISVLDTYGSHLAGCLDKAPTIVHNNVSEVAASLGIDLSTEDLRSAYLLSLYNKGIKQSFLTDGNNDFIVANHDFLMKITVPDVPTFDATGSGDAFTAGLVYGWHQDLVFEEMVRLSVTLGAVNASQESVCKVSKSQLETFSGNVTITPVGKKMRNLDVTPTIYG